MWEFEAKNIVAKLRAQIRIVAKIAQIEINLLGCAPHDQYHQSLKG